MPDLHRARRWPPRATVPAWQIAPCVTADISVFTAGDEREAQRTHVNLVVNDTITWEPSAACHLDRHPAIRAFVNNPGLNFAIPYLHNGKHFCISAGPLSGIDAASLGHSPHAQSWPELNLRF